MDTTSISPGEAQASTHGKQQTGFSSVPTTKVLAIRAAQRAFNARATQGRIAARSPRHGGMYLNSKIDQWWSRQDGKGPVFRLNVDTLDEAKALIASLPLSVTGLMECDFIELGPLRPLRLLLKEG